MTELTMDTEFANHRKPGQIRGWLEVLSIVLLMPVGGFLGGLTGFVPAGAIFSVALPLLAATLYLSREGTSWMSLLRGTRLSAGRIAAYTFAALVFTSVLVTASDALVRMAGLPPTDLTLFQTLLEGNLGMYLWFLIPVAWGSAAIGEEILARGFLLHRTEGLTGTVAAVILQAALFALAHSYQGPSGMINIFVLALVFGAVYVKCGRNLLPLILAHGLIDTISLTMIYLGHADLLVGS